MRMPVVALLAALGLMACSKAEEPASASAATAPQVAATIGDFDLTQPIRAMGSEPYWTVDIAGGTITFVDAEDAIGDRPTPRTATAPTPAITGDTAVYAVTLSDGTPLRVMLKAETCPDMGEETRALTSRVTLGTTTWESCADARSAYPEDSPAM